MKAKKRLLHPANFNLIANKPVLYICFCPTKENLQNIIQSDLQRENLTIKATLVSFIIMYSLPVSQNNTDLFKYLHFSKMQKVTAKEKIALQESSK